MGAINVDSKAQKIKYKDVVVIGNGPSGINLSYMLSGNCPYYNGGVLPDEYLQMRMDTTQGVSLVEQDLEFLSSGLEGRSSSPVAVLFDTLTHPYADMGQQAASLLEWRNDGQGFDHVVLGKNAEGGVWQMLKGDMQTLSLGNWMELPGLPFKQWLGIHRQNKYSRLTVHNEDRASIDEVRCYYEDYVKIHNLGDNFHNYTTVTRVERVLDMCHGVDSESGEQIPCEKDHCDKCMWEVTGYETLSNGCTHEFCYRASHVVIASGAHDQPNKLGVSGEHLPFIHYNLHEVEALIRTRALHAGTSDPLVVIGAGLSAADAIIYALNAGINVVHVFRHEQGDNNTVYRSLPTSVYPEYSRISELMQGKAQNNLYTCYPAHNVVEFSDASEVMIRHHNDDQCTGTVVLSASCVVVQIGYKADLSYLPQAGLKLGKDQTLLVHPKHNPISVNPFTYESVHPMFNNLFSIGPLVGDNFVRFLCGGALAITSHLWRKRRKNSVEE